MKKRLLITSIVMMLVVAVALSTATYAWFTSNTSVTANSVTMTAGTSASSALGIAWQKSTHTEFTPEFNNDYLTYVTPYEYEGQIQPAAPTALQNAEPQFYTAFIDAQGKFKTTPSAETPVFRFANMASNGEGYSNLIHVANLAQSGTVGVRLTAQILAIYTAVNPNTDRNDAVWYTKNDGTDVVVDAQITNSGSETTYYTKDTSDASDLVRIAVYEVTVSGETPTYSYSYMGLLSKTAATTTPSPVPNTAVGSIVANNSASALVTASSVTSLQLTNLAAQEDHAYAIYVWLDGALFDEGRSGNRATVSLTFESTTPSV